MNFLIGDKVTCLYDDWKNTNKVKNFVCPKNGEVVHIQGIAFKNGMKMLSLAGYPSMNFYASKHFRPIDRMFPEDVIENLGLNKLERLK